MSDNTPSDQPAIEMNTLHLPTDITDGVPPRAGIVNSELPSHRQLAKGDYAVGIGLLVIVVFLWTGSNFVTQNMFDGGYAKPFLVSYLNTSVFSLYLFPAALRLLWRNWASKFPRRQPEYQRLATAPDGDRNLPPIYPNLHSDDPLSTEETAKLALLFGFLWFVSNWCLNASLEYTNVANVSILSAMSGFFVLALCQWFPVESLTWAKVGAVVISFGGVLLVSLADSKWPSAPPIPESPSPSPESPSPSPVLPWHLGRRLLGDILALLSAAVYACYIILLKIRIRSESRIDMLLLFGFVGLLIMFSCWPVVVLLHFLGLERFEWPSTRKDVTELSLNVAFSLTSNFIYVVAMFKTTPLIVTIGLSLTIPLSVIGDFFLNKPTNSQVMIGAALVVSSFVVVGIDNARRPEPLEQDKCEDELGTEAA